MGGFAVQRNPQKMWQAPSWHMKKVCSFGKIIQIQCVCVWNIANPHLSQAPRNKVAICKDAIKKKNVSIKFYFSVMLLMHLKRLKHSTIMKYCILQNAIDRLTDISINVSVIHTQIALTYAKRLIFLRSCHFMLSAFQLWISSTLLLFCASEPPLEAETQSEPDEVRSETTGESNTPEG